MQRFAKGDLDAFDCGRVLEHFGLSPQTRGPCPFCHTSDTSQAFTHKGPVYFCHACGTRGDSIQLYAHLGGIRAGRAMAEIAAHLGLNGDVDPAEWDKRKAAREAAQVLEREAKQAESWRLTRLAKEGYEAEREAEWLKAMAMKYKSRELLGMAYEAEGRMMVADYLLFGDEG